MEKVDNKLNSKEKAAILLICLGEDHAAQIYKHLGEDEIEQLTLSLSAVHRVSPQMKEEVLEEFYEICLAQEYISEGGIGYARNVLERALGENRAEELIKPADIHAAGPAFRLHPESRFHAYPEPREQ